MNIEKLWRLGANSGCRALATLTEHQKQMMARGLPTRKKLDSVQHIICVASGKGGVGKSTIAVNLACSFANQFKLRTGILDADIYGPSVPKMMNLSNCTEIEVDARGAMLPLTNYNVKCMSMGFLVDEKAPIVWRGLMVMNALERLLFKVNWGPLDILVIDMPPGTGDVQLSLGQNLLLDGAVIVSTPQTIALIDARKMIEMFRKINVPVLGVVQNMSVYSCAACKHTEHIFGEEGAKLLAAEMGVQSIGDLPLISEIRATSDSGKPMASVTDNYVAGYFNNICQNIIDQLRIHRN